MVSAMEFRALFSLLQPHRAIIMKAEIQQVTVNGHAIIIRPIRPDDATREADFVRNLSAETKHFRFFGALSELSAAQVKRFCTIDGPNCMAFVALHREGTRDVEIGVCRYAPCDKADARELAITIADQWQHTELPQLLLRSLVQCAKQFAIHELFAVELSIIRACTISRCKTA
jgi:hypothetical protein